MRLIDADALMDLFRGYMNANYNKEKCVSAEDCENCNGCLWKKVVDNAPTIEAEPVKHGEWVDKRVHGRTQSWCSACGAHSGIGGIESNRHKPFCPNCSAKMDKEDNTDEN